MEKDALLEIVLHDLKEVETLVQSVKGKATLSNAFFKLTQNRIHSILDEINMLKELSDSNSSESTIQPAAGRANGDLMQVAEKRAEEKTDQAPPRTKDENHVEAGDDKKPGWTSPADATNQPETESIQPETPKAKETKPPEENNTQENRNKEAGLKSTVEKLKEKSNEPPKRETAKVLGEKLVKEKASFNEQIGKSRMSSGKKRSLTAPPVADLRKALGINDRFFYQRELFNGNSDLMNQTLDQLNAMSGIHDAQNFLLANFNWDPENEAVLSFMDLVERRYF